MVRRLGTGSHLSCLDDGGTPADKSDDTWTIYAVPEEPNFWFDVVAIGPGGAPVFGCNTRQGVAPFLLLDEAGTPMDPSDDGFLSFTLTDGLAGDHVGGIAVDPSGGLWVGTNGGRSYFRWQ